jgi:hypothetical protein
VKPPHKYDGIYNYRRWQPTHKTKKSVAENREAILSKLIKELEDELKSLGDDSQLANVDLQGALKEQQQLLKLLADIANLSFDIATAIMRKID